MASLWVGAAVNHFLRSGSASAAFAAAHDEAVVRLLCTVLQMPDEGKERIRDLAGLPLLLGGLGMQLAVRRRPAAFLAAAEATVSDLLTSLHLSTVADLCIHAPGWSAAVRSAEHALRAYGASLPGSRWDLPNELPVWAAKRTCPPAYPKAYSVLFCLDSLFLLVLCCVAVAAPVAGHFFALPFSLRLRFLSVSLWHTQDGDCYALILVHWDVPPASEWPRMATRAAPLLRPILGHTRPSATLAEGPWYVTTLSCMSWLGGCVHCLELPCMLNNGCHILRGSDPMLLTLGQG